jgi:hypothetical protein
LRQNAARMLSRITRGLPSTGALLAVAVSVAACGSSQQPTQTTRVASVRPATPKTNCIPAHGRFSGLGVSVKAFRAGNNTSQPYNPAPGDIAYTILKTARGCVTAFRLDIWTSPNPSGEQAAQAIFPELADAVAPISAKSLPGGSGSMYCQVWSSRSLQKKTGDRYAVAIGEYAGIGDNAIAEIVISKTPNCELPISAFGTSDANGL